MPHKFGAARLIVRADGIRAAEGRVISVEKNYRDTHAYKLFVQIEIRVRHCGFCTLYQYAVNGIFQYFFENSALVADAVAGRRKNRGVLVLGQHFVHSPQLARKNVVADIRCNYRYLSGSWIQPLRSHHRTAALPLYYKIVFHQERQRLAYRLAADIILGCEQLLGRYRLTLGIYAVFNISFYCLRDSFIFSHILSPL